MSRVIRTLLALSCALAVAGCQSTQSAEPPTVAATTKKVPKLPKLTLSRTVCADKGWAAIGSSYGWKHQVSSLGYALGGLPVDTCQVGGGRKLSVAITPVTDEAFAAAVLAKRTALGLPRTVLGADEASAWAGYGMARVGDRFVSYEAKEAGVLEVIKALGHAVTLLPTAAKAAPVAGAGECSLIAGAAGDFLDEKVTVQRGTRSSSDVLRCSWAASGAAVSVEASPEFDAPGEVQSASGSAEEIDLGEFSTFDAKRRTLRAAVSAQLRITIVATSGKRPVADYIALYEAVRDGR